MDKTAPKYHTHDMKIQGFVLAHPSETGGREASTSTYIPVALLLSGDRQQCFVLHDCAELEQKQVWRRVLG